MRLLTLGAIAALVVTGAMTTRMEDKIAEASPNDARIAASGGYYYYDRYHRRQNSRPPRVTGNYNRSLAFYREHPYWYRDQYFNQGMDRRPRG